LLYPRVMASRRCDRICRAGSSDQSWMTPCR
jgi:hypothetical protein